MTENAKSQCVAVPERELLPLSLLNNFFLYCPRRAALKEIEGKLNKAKMLVARRLVWEIKEAK